MKLTLLNRSLYIFKLHLWFSGLLHFVEWRLDVSEAHATSNLTVEMCGDGKVDKDVGKV
jgi:hypothetical protein